MHAKRQKTIGQNARNQSKMTDARKKIKNNRKKNARNQSKMVDALKEKKQQEKMQETKARQLMHAKR